jgi:hypothetical protein
MAQRKPAPFRVVMSNEGGELDSREARDEAHAGEVLAEMIAELGTFQAGDTFRIEGPSDDDSEAAVDINSPALAAHPVAQANAASWPAGPKRRKGHGPVTAQEKASIRARKEGEAGAAESWHAAAQATVDAVNASKSLAASVDRAAEQERERAGIRAVRAIHAAKGEHLANDVAASLWHGMTPAEQAAALGEAAFADRMRRTLNN